MKRVLVFCCVFLLAGALGCNNGTPPAGLSTGGALATAALSLSNSPQGSAPTPLPVNARSSAEISVQTTPGSAPAKLVQSGSVDLAVTEFGLTQGVAGEPLILNKATVARAKVTLPDGQQVNAQVVVNVDGKEYSNTAALTGPESFVTVKVDDPTALKPIAARITVQAGGGVSDPDASNNTASVTAQTIRTTEKVQAFFLPVDWSPADRTRYAFDTAYAKFVQDNADFFAGAYPLARGQLETDSTPVVHMLTSFEKTLADNKGEFNYRNALAMYASISIAGRRYNPDATIVVGVMPPGWFRSHGRPGTLGLTLREVKGTVTGEFDPTDPTTAAHEVGHLYWLYEDYDYAVKPPRPGVEITTPEYWVQRDLQMITKPGKALWTYLSSGSKSITYWTDERLYEYLMSKFALNGGEASAPMVTSATMAWRVENEGYPSDYSAGIRRFEPDDKINVSAGTMGLKAGAKLEARWYRGSTLLTTQNASAVGGNKFYPFTLPYNKNNPYPEGQYRVEIYLDGQLTKTANFEVKKGL